MRTGSGIFAHGVALKFMADRPGRIPWG